MYEVILGSNEIAMMQFDVKILIYSNKTKDLLVCKIFNISQQGLWVFKLKTFYYIMDNNMDVNSYLLTVL